MTIIVDAKPLLDTPGILWPKLEQETVALNLAAMSAIKEDILPLDKVACHILTKLATFYPEILKMRYNLESITDFEEAYNIIAEKCRHQAHFSVGISVNYRNKNIPYR